MLSKAASWPRVCLRCRIGYMRYSTGLLAHAQLAPGDPTRRQHVSDGSSASRDEDVRRPPAGGEGDKEGQEHVSAHRHADGHARGLETSTFSRVQDPDENFEDAFSARVLDNQPTRPQGDLKTHGGDISEILQTIRHLRNDFAAETRDGCPRRFRHQLLDNHQLGIDALGRPVDALVLKNPNQMRKARKLVPMIEEEAPAVQPNVDWHDLVPERDQSLSDAEEEVRQNIEELRPKEDGLLLKWEFSRLTNALVDGFTRDQLVHYYSHTEKESRPQIDESPSYTWIKEQKPWTPVNSRSHDTLTPKQTLAVMILQERWGLEKQESVEGIGEKRLWLSDSAFKTVFRNSQACLKALKGDLLDLGIGEDVVPDFMDNAVTIYARRPSIAAILQQIDSFVQSQVSRLISIESIRPGDLQRPVLDVLERITRTSLEVRYHKDKSPKELLVRWNAGDSEGRNPRRAKKGDPVAAVLCEDPADLVYRLLDRTSWHYSHREHHIQMPTKRLKTTRAVFVQYLQSNRSLSWRDKLRVWYRYVSPVSRKKRTTRPRHMSRRVELPSNPLLVPGRAADDRLMATFGHILHTKNKLDEKTLASSRRVLNPVVPHPASLASISSMIRAGAADQQTFITLTFTARRGRKTAFRTNPPEIQLRIPVGANLEVSLNPLSSHASLHCVVPWYENDVLMPGESVDVRLEQQRWLQVDVTDIDSQQKPLQEFLAASEVDVLEGRFRTPAFTTFNISRQWLFPKPYFPITEEVAKLQYRFAGLEIHRTTTAEWQGQTLRYNSIDAGHHGGLRQELSIEAGSLRDHDEGLSEAQQKDFLKLVGDVAMGKVFSWSDGHTPVQELAGQRELSTADSSLDEYGAKEHVQDETRPTREEERGEAEGTAGIEDQRIEEGLGETERSTLPDETRASNDSSPECALFLDSPSPTEQVVPVSETDFDSPSTEATADQPPEANRDQHSSVEPAQSFSDDDAGCNAAAAARAGAGLLDDTAKFQRPTAQQGFHDDKEKSSATQHLGASAAGTSVSSHVEDCETTAEQVGHSPRREGEEEEARVPRRNE